MQSSDQQNVVLGYPQHPTVVATPGSFPSPITTHGNMWGFKCRSTMGFLQIICGVIEFALGIAVICIPSDYYDVFDYVGWAIWTGMVVAYMVTSIIAAVLSSGCLIYAVMGIMFIVDNWDHYNPANLVAYTCLCVTFGSQMLISILGANFSCKPVCNNTNQQPQIIYYGYQTPPSLPSQLSSMFVLPDAPPSYSPVPPSRDCNVTGPDISCHF